ncbi:MAG: sodium-dependent transporter [Pseudomonadota bacterium]|nr:MAG: sodium-dependent transporter [Pseudomonadota bacterium]
MVSRRQSIHGEWSSRWAFILAATGSAVGLGNIWKFPYMTGENGGGAFVLVYLLCVAVIGIPIMMAETMLGRRGRQSPINTMQTLAIEAGHTPRWHFVGWIGVLAGFLILSYYSVIAGWALAYVLRTGTGVFTGATADGVEAIFSDFVSNPESLLGWHTLFMAMTMIVVARGVQGGLEKAVKFLMPGLFIILVVLVGYAMNAGEFAQAMRYLFSPSFENLSPEAILAAMGQAFFSLSLGMGAIMVYGSYLPHDASIAGTSVRIAIADTLVAVLAGMAIFPLVFAHNLEPGAGPGLIFQTLPLVFGHMPGGVVFGTLFFVLLVFAAWTSSISLIEPAVAYLVENRGVRRSNAAVIVAGACWALGLLTVLSFNVWSDVHPLGMFETFKDKTPFDLLDYLTSNIMLPLGGFMIAIFSVWIMSRDASRDELDLHEGWEYPAWRFLVRYVTPVAVVTIFLNAIDAI